MGKTCVVLGCKNKDSGKHKKEKVKFHRIPKEEPRRSMWIKAINRREENTGKLWIPSSNNDRVCSEHFVLGKSDDPESPDYKPTMDMGYCKGSETASRRFSRLSRRNYKKSLDEFFDERSRSANASKRQHDGDDDDDVVTRTDTEMVAHVLLNLSNHSTENKENNNDRFLHDMCMKRIAELNMEKKKILREMARLQEEIHSSIDNTPKMRASTLLNLSTNSNESTLFYTGLPSHDCFIWLSSFLADSFPSSSILTSADILLLVLMKLRLNVPHRDLSYRFDIAPSLVSSLLDSALPVFAKQVRFFIHWPAREEARQSQPLCIKETYPSCISIVDCTEVFIESPSNFNARSATYSNYKHANTIKFLVSIAPSGGVSFISRAYGGRASDKVISLESGYLDFIQHGDTILADRGFLITDELLSRGAKPVIPAYQRGKEQLSAREVEMSRRIAHVRIHVERAMERLKNFRILSGKMSLNMVPHADSIMTICAAIMNMHPRLVN